MRATRAKAVLLVLVVVTSGCAGNPFETVGQDGTLSFSAEPISLPSDVVADSGYELDADESVSLETSVTVSDQSRDIDMEVHKLSLTRSFEGSALGTVVLLSVPQAEIGDRRIDLAAEAGPESLLEQAHGPTQNLYLERAVAERSAEILGETRTVSVFNGSAAVNGSQESARIHHVTADHEGDTIVGIAVLPRTAATDDAAVIALFESVQHDTDG